MAVLKVSNDADTDHSVLFLFSEKQPAQVEELWYDIISRKATHAQRDRLLETAPLGFVPVDVSSPRLAAFRNYIRENSQRDSD